MILLQVKINLLQNPSSVFSLATLVFKKVIDVIPQIFGGTLSLPMSASLRLVPSFLLLVKSPIILVSHNPSLQKSLLCPLYQPLFLYRNLSLSQHPPFAPINEGHVHRLLLKTHLLLHRTLIFRILHWNCPLPYGKVTGHLGILILFMLAI
jgi:hypothetical protein